LKNRVAYSLQSVPAAHLATHEPTNRVSFRHRKI